MDLEKKFFSRAWIALVITSILFNKLSQADELSAQDASSSSAPKATLKLADLVKEAVTSRPALEAARQEAEAKRAQVSPAGAYDDPMVGFSAVNYPVNTLSRRDSGMAGNEWMVSQKIRFPGKLTKLQNAAQFDAEAKFQAAGAKERDVVREVKTAYYGLYLAHRKNDILSEQIGLLRQLLSVARGQFVLGKMSQAEILAMQSEEGLLMSQILGAQKEIELMRAELNFAIGKPLVSRTERPGAISRTIFDLSKPAQEKLQSSVLNQNLDIKAASLGFNAAESKLGYAKLNYLPDFEFKFAYMLREPTAGDLGIDSVTGSVSMSVPLWFFAKQTPEVNAARAEKVRAEAQVDEQKNYLIQQTHKVLAELEEADQKIKLYEGGLLPLSRQAVMAGKSAYMAGKLEYGAMINSFRNWFQTELSSSEALVNYETKIAELEVLLARSL